MLNYQEKYDTYAALMAEEGPLSKLESLLVLVHALNRSNQFVCISEDEECEFPRTWRTPSDDAYSFTYLNPQTKALLNLTARQKGSRLEIIMGEVRSKQSYRVLLEIEGTLQANAKQYDFTFQEYLKEAKGSGSSRNVPVRREQPSTFNNTPRLNANFTQVPQSNLPKTLVNPPDFVHNPFGQEEYVGPNSQIFVNPNQSPNFNPGSLRIPPGARYERVDPFDNPLIEQPTGPQDFFGFDEFGRPKKAPFQGPFQGGRGNGFNGLGGFGNGFGNGFGPL